MASSQGTVTRFEWERTIAALPLPYRTKLVALVLATYSTAKTGEHAHPGEDRLASDCGMSERTVRRHLVTLRYLRLVERTYKGKANQYRRTADEYALAIPEDAAEAVDDLNRYRTLVTGSTEVGTGQNRSLVPVTAGSGTGQNESVLAVTSDRPSHKTTDVYHVKTNSPITVAAQSTDRARGPDKRLCENCGHPGVAADGECLACQHIQKKMNVK